MALSIWVDWSDEANRDRFDLTCPNEEFHEENGSGWSNAKNKDDYEGCPCCEDDSGYLQPMMNYVYPLDYQGMVSDEEFNKGEGRKRRIEIASKTNCICIQDTKNNEEWFLALTGGGMDLSFSIAHAFMIAQKWLPKDLIDSLEPEWCRSNLREDVFKELRNVCVDQLGRESDKFKDQKAKWDKVKAKQKRRRKK